MFISPCICFGNGYLLRAGNDFSSVGLAPIPQASSLKGSLTPRSRSPSMKNYKTVSALLQHPGNRNHSPKTKVAVV